MDYQCVSVFSSDPPAASSSECYLPYLRNSLRMLFQSSGAVYSNHRVTSTFTRIRLPQTAHLPEHIFIWPNSHCMTRSHWRSLQSEKHQTAGREDKSGELQSSTRDLSVCSCLAVGWIDFVRRVNSKMFCVRLPSPCDRCDSDESDPKEMMLRAADLKNYSNGPLSLCSLPLIDRHWFERYFIYLKIWILLKNIIYLPPYFGRSLKNEYICFEFNILFIIH